MGVSTSRKPRASKNCRKRRSRSARNRSLSQLAVGRKSSDVVRWLVINSSDFQFAERLARARCREAGQFGGTPIDAGEELCARPLARAESVRCLHDERNSLCSNELYCALPATRWRDARTNGGRTMAGLRKWNHTKELRSGRAAGNCRGWAGGAVCIIVWRCTDGGPGRMSRHMVDRV